MNSGPLSVISIAGFPRVSIKRCSTSATRRPPIEVSTSIARQARVKSSTTVRRRKRRPSSSTSRTKSSDQRSLMRVGEPGHAARHAPPSFATTDGETFRCVQSIDALELHAKAFAPEQHVEPSIPEPSPLAGQLPEAVAQCWPLEPSESIAAGRAAESDERAGPSLTPLELRLDRPHRGPLRHGRQAFFPTSSFRAWLSSVRSATRRLSRLFSCSSVRRRRASLTSRPAYFAFQR